MQSIWRKHPQAETIGELKQNLVPWTVVTGLDPSHKQLEFFTEEFFGPFTSEVVFEEEDTVAFINKAVEFCNDTLWGTLSASIIVHPDSLKNPKINAAVEKAITDLRYGTVAVNEWPGISFLIGNLPWGGYPGAKLNDIQSGNVFVQNPMLLDKVEKSVIRAPFRSSMPPLATHINPDVEKFGKSLTEFAKHPTKMNLIKTMSRAIYDTVLIKLRRH